MQDLSISPCHTMSVPSSLGGAWWRHHLGRLWVCQALPSSDSKHWFWGNGSFFKRNGGGLVGGWKQGVMGMVWFYDRTKLYKIRYDQGWEGGGVAISAKPIGSHPTTIPKTIITIISATAKPIGAHPTYECPFTMFQWNFVRNSYESWLWVVIV